MDRQSEPELVNCLGTTRAGSDAKTRRLPAVLAIATIDGTDLSTSYIFNQTREHGSSGKILCNVTSYRLVGTGS